MSRISVGFAVVGIAAVGATVFYAAQSITNRPLASLKEKEKETAEKIKRLVEDESETGGTQQRSRSKAKTIALAGGAQSQAVVSHEETPSGQCAPVEFFGKGPEDVQVDPAAWSQFMGEYHAAKADLLQWISANKASFGEAEVKRMEAEVRATRVMRPQNQIETDLTWRGIAAWTRPRSGASQGAEIVEQPALIHVGSGFMDLFVKNRARARFEIARLLAQSWGPCEQGNAKDAQIWKDFYACMGLTEEQVKCSAGTVSESTWAMSTAVASLVSKPGCDIPAFADTQGKSNSCLKSFHRGDVASYPIEESKPASRAVASAKGAEKER
jgi:hypothetical protein